MPQPSKIPLAFAASGDKNAIPEITETTGLASWREGFPAITSAPFSEGGIAPKRADFNGIFNALSQAVMWMQQGGVYAYDANMNYEAGNVVLDTGGLYVANSANGPSSVVVQPSSDTTGATWKLVRLDLATPIAAGYMSAEDKTLVDSIPGLGTFNRMFFSQISGSYIAPRTGVYRITLKGGGGGGGGAEQNGWTRQGGSGGEGGTLIFYKKLTSGQSYQYVIGAGGQAGSNGTVYNTSTGGGRGGVTSFNNEYTIEGGGGGNSASSSQNGGAGGGAWVAPSGESVYVIPGAPGTAGTYNFISEPAFIFPAGSSGGGQGGGTRAVASILGGGGCSGASRSDATSPRPPLDGGTGFILIEYQGGD